MQGGGQILESRIDQQGGTEFCPLLIKPLLSRILISSHPRGFLLSVDIIQESSSGGRGGICHKPIGCGYTADTQARKEVSDKPKRRKASNFLALGGKTLKRSRKLSGVKHADAEEVRNHQVDRGVPMRDP